VNRKGNKNKIFVIGLDGATFDIIDPLIEGGKLPNLEKLIGSGSRATMRSVIPPFSPPAWMSMLTGKNPGKHGVFHFLKRRKGSYDLEVASFRDVKAKTLFSILAGADIGSGVMNIPMTYPPPNDVKGFFVSGIPVPPGTRSFVAPDDLYGILEKGGYEVDYDFRGFDPNREEAFISWERYEKLLNGLRKIARKRVDILLDLIDKEDLPLYFFVISLTDRIQHYFWRFTDTKHPGYSDEGNRRFGDAIESAYILADELVGRIMEKGGDGADYILVSDHGAGPHYADFHLNGWLIDNGYMKIKEIPRLAIKHAPLRDVLTRLGAGFLMAILPGSWTSKVVPYLGKKRYLDPGDIIWSETRAYASMFGIRVNQRGREPEGIVEAGKEYRELLDRIKETLGLLDNPLDGRRLLTDCITKEEAYSGAYLDGSPDLFLELGGISVLPIGGWARGEPCIPRRNSPSSGTHRIEGIFIGSGPAFRGGVDLGEIKIEDVMPTILHLSDLPISSDLDGEVILNALKEEKPVKIREVLPESAEETGSRKGYTDEEEDQIAENLRGMGYI
jgi:predicted AlkP superfamily phosphohydrolase/phosphomutase